MRLGERWICKFTNASFNFCRFSFFLRTLDLELAVIACFSVLPSDFYFHPFQLYICLFVDLLSV